MGRCRRRLLAQERMVDEIWSDYTTAGHRCGAYFCLFQPQRTCGGVRPEATMNMPTNDMSNREILMRERTACEFNRIKNSGSSFLEYLRISWNYTEVISRCVEGYGLLLLGGGKAVQSSLRKTGFIFPQKKQCFECGQSPR